MIGFRVCERHRQISEKWFAQFKLLSVANISDVMARITAGGPTIRPYYSGESMVGAALTVKTRPGDNLMVHKALDMAGPGDVIVVDAGGDLTNAIIGELMVAHATQRGLAGIVIAGAIRDSEVLRSGRFPVFAAGITHRGPYKDGPGEINVSISINGMVVAPGDLVCGDADGIVTVGIDDVQTVYEMALVKQAKEVALMDAIKAGTSDRTWVDAELNRLGCTVPHIF